MVATRPLYHMLETVRAYAALELTAAGERDDALEGLVRYCTGEASLAAEGLSDPRRSNGWIACVTISRTTAAPWRGSSSAAVPPKRPTSRGG